MSKPHESLQEGLEPPGVPAWLHKETVRSLAELNEQCLELLAAQAAAMRPGVGHPMLRELKPLWAALNADARRRVADCPYLLVDVGFADARRWAWASGRGVQDREATYTPTFFTVPQTVGVTRIVLTYAWLLARSQVSAARLLLGMPPQCAGLLATCSLRQITEIAESHPQWLQPRWPGRVRVWRDLLSSAMQSDSRTLDRLRLHGLRLLASEVAAQSQQGLDKWEPEGD